MNFNARVLHEARDPRTPLLEKVKFVQIFSTNLDEFFMKRMARLGLAEIVGREKAAEQQARTELFTEIRRRIHDQLRMRDECWQKTISPELEREGVLLLGWSDLSAQERGFVERYFEEQLFPVLTPLAVDPGHPFPFLSNLSTSVGVLLKNPRSVHTSDASYKSQALFARVKLPPQFPTWVRVEPTARGGREERFISLQSIIIQFIGRLFPGMDIEETFPFRVTRNAEIEHEEEEAENLLKMVSDELRERRFGDIVRLEHSPTLSPLVERFLRTELDITDDHVYEYPNDLDYSSLGSIANLNIPRLKDRPWTPLVPESLLDDESSIFGSIRKQDLLVHHPYESFSQTVQRFVATAADDPKVLAIKMTLYRTGADSPFLPLLVRAAEAGKQVVCLVELKARFDEERNIHVARVLTKAGVHVVYGIVGLKTHCKLALVVRKESEGIRSYVHLGTGNYHAASSKVYTDFSLFTAKPEFTRDVSELFHYLTGRSRKRDYQKLLVAPVTLKERLLSMIRLEAEAARKGRPAQIVAKMNSLQDREVIKALCDASRAGVEIDLIVRGVCCFVPGVPGVSDNIRVTSVVGRFLEHSRVYCFRNGAENPVDGRFFIASADWMTRNLEHRIEAVIPIDDMPLRAQLWDFLQMLLQDQRQVWELMPTGAYQQRVPASDAQEVGVHEKLMRLYETAQRNSFTQPSTVIRGWSNIVAVDPPVPQTLKKNF